jgi:hypothetical protein
VAVRGGLSAAVIPAILEAVDVLVSSPTAISPTGLKTVAGPDSHFGLLPVWISVRHGHLSGSSAFSPEFGFLSFLNYIQTVLLCC